MRCGNLSTVNPPTSLKPFAARLSGEWSGVAQKRLAPAVAGLSRCRRILPVILASAVWISFSARGADNSLLTLTNFPQVLALSRSEATDDPQPVRVRGIVAFPAHGPRDMFHIHSGTNGLGVTPFSLPGLRTSSLLLPQVGQLVEVEGETSFGSSHPFVARAKVRVLGPGQFPEPRQTRGSELAAGRHHGNMVKLRATILDVARTRSQALLLLNADGAGFYAELNEVADRLPTEWLGANVEVQGMPWLQFDGPGKVTSFRLLIGSNAWVRILKPGSSNLYAGPQRMLREVADAPVADDRIVVSGLVTHSSALNFFTLQDATGVAFTYALTPIAKTSRDGGYIERPPRPELLPGDRVQVVASKNSRRAYAPQLNGAEYRVIGHEALAEPPLITDAAALSGAHDCRRVRIRGRVVDRDLYTQSGAKVNRLWIKFGDLTSYAVHAGSNHVEFPIPTGSMVELTGLCVVDAGTDRPVRRFSIYVDSTSDVRPLAERPLWMSSTVLRIAGISGGALTLALGWVWLLRRQVARQTAELRRSNEQLEAEARERERAETERLARMRLLALNADVAVALNEVNEQRPMLQRCAEILAHHLDAAFARIWTLNDTTRTLELQASAGCYTHLDGPHSREPVGQFKIGLIAQERQPHVTNDAANDERVHDKDWARREGMVAFAGYPLLIEGRVLGVVAMFARRHVSDEVVQALGSAARSIALGIERKRAVSRLLESEERFSKAFQASPALIAITRLSDGAFIAANEAFLKTSSYTEAEVIGRRALDLNIYAIPQQREEYVQLIRTHGSVRDREHLLRTKDGTLRTVLSSGELLELDREPHLLTVGLDITGRKRAEVETLKALAREKELSELKSNFVSMVSHEFRTPLGVIQSASDVLDRYLDRLPPEKRRKHLDMIFRSTRNLTQLVEGVLLLGKVEDGRLLFAPTQIDLPAACVQLVDEVISATTAVSPIEFAPGSGLETARCDIDLLRHIVNNLLTNAVKYSALGTPVKFTVERQGTNAVFTVSDHGIGIADEDRAHLFQSFARGRNVGPRPGTGLGLVIVQRCVQLHGGTIELQSALGQGTTVTVTLPVFGDNPHSDSGPKLS